MGRIAIQSGETQRTSTQRRHMPHIRPRPAATRPRRPTRRALAIVVSVAALAVFGPAGSVVGGHGPTEIVAASASNHPNIVIDDEGTTVIQRSITLPWRARILARASLDVYSSQEGPVTGYCFLSIGGAVSSQHVRFYSAYFDNDVPVPLVGSRVMPAGTHAVRAVCVRTDGWTLSYYSGHLNILGVRMRDAPRQVTSAARSNDPDPDVGITDDLNVVIQRSISLPWEALVLTQASLGIRGQVDVPTTIWCSSRPPNTTAYALTFDDETDRPAPLTNAYKKQPGAWTAAARCAGQGDGALSYRAGDLTVLAVREGTSPTEVRAEKGSSQSWTRGFPVRGVVVMKRSIVLPWQAMIVADASIELGEPILHDATARSDVQNASCRLEIGAPRQPIGERQYVDMRDTGAQNVDMVLVPLGGAVVKPAGSYTVKVVCYGAAALADVTAYYGDLALVAVRR